jgi:phage portal protein BeeE
MAKRKSYRAKQIEHVPSEVQTPAFFASGVPLPNDLEDMAKAYGNHVWVYAGMKVIADAIASMPILPYRKEGTSRKNWIVNEVHPFYKLVCKRPNSFYSSGNLKEFTALSMYSAGMGYWTLTRTKASKEVLEIIPIPAHDVKVVPSKEKPVDHYLYNVNGKDIRLEFDDIIQHKFVSLEGMSYGQSVVGDRRRAASHHGGPLRAVLE